MREPDLVGEIDIGDAGIFLQGAEDTAVDRIQVCWHFVVALV